MRTASAPYRSEPTGRTRRLRHPRRWIADAIGVGFALAGAFAFTAIFRLDGFTLGPVAALVGGGLPVALAAYSRARSAKLELEADGIHLTIRVSRWPRRPLLVRARVDELEAVSFMIFAGHYRVVLRTNDGALLPLTDDYDLGGGELQRELARVQAFLFPGREAPVIPANVLDTGPTGLAGSARLAFVLVCVFAGCGGVALYGLKRKNTHYQTAEATRRLGAIESAARNSFERGIKGPGGATIHAFCPSAPQVPHLVPRGIMVRVGQSELDAEGWRCLGFELQQPVRFAYHFESNYPATGSAATFTAAAYGDLDGDDVHSSFVLVGQGSSDGSYRRVSFRITNENE